MIEEQAPPMLRSTVVAGVGAGLLSAVPVLGGLLLLAFCSPVIGCGLLASYLYSRACREAAVPFTPAMGRTVGLVSGAFWAATMTVFAVASWPGIDRATEDVERLWDAMGQTTPELLDALDQFRGLYEDSSAAMLVLSVFFLYLLVAAVFSTIGGMIGGAVFRSRGPDA